MSNLDILKMVLADGLVFSLIIYLVCRNDKNVKNE